MTKTFILIFLSLFATSGCGVRMKSSARGTILQVNTDPLFQGNIGYWTLTESSGTSIVKDYSAYSNSGTAQGSLILGDAGHAAGTAATFDNVSNPYVSIPALSTYDVNHITLAGWAKSSQTSGIGLIMNGDNNSTANQRKFQFRLSGGKFSCIIFVQNGGSYAAIEVKSPASVADGNWHHLVCTYDEQNIKVYVDQVLVNSVAETRVMNSATPTIYLGRYWSSPFAFLGSASHLGIWDVALSSDEVADLYSK